MPPDIQQATGGQPNAGQTAPSNQPIAGQEAAAPSAMTSAAPDEGQNAAQSQSNLAANGQPASATAASAAEPAPAGHVYGQPKPARVVAHATAKSWIQVSDASGKVLTTRTMQEGDVYNAPDKKGLVMWTGNAGALQFTVDGHPEPRVGRLGESMRHVSLDPSSISHGTIQ
jgi:cytoskeleton protein RodZ